MIPVAIGLLAFLCFLGAALVGFWLAQVLPESAINERTRSLIEDAREMLVALTTLTLGLIIASANTSFEKRANEIESSAAKIVSLDAMLTKYGPKAKESRETLRLLLKKGIERIDAVASEGFEASEPRKGIGVNRLQVGLLELHPENDRENWLRSSALTLSHELASFRWLRYSAAESGVQWPFLGIMMFWLVIVFLGYGVVAPRNGVALGTLLLLAAAMATAIELTLDLDSPNRGLIKISSSPLRAALDQIGPADDALPPASAVSAEPAAPPSSPPPPTKAPLVTAIAKPPRAERRERRDPETITTATRLVSENPGFRHASASPAETDSRSSKKRSRRPICSSF